MKNIKKKLEIQGSRITCLEYQIDDQLNRIIVLEKDNQELKKDKQELNNTINTLNNRIIVLEKDNQELKIK